MPKRTDIKKIMIIGAGPIVIGQACEFDYSGTQACKVLRKEGYEIVLVNSNPASIMTDPEFADRTYIEPINPDILTKIIEKERPDALLPTLGGQTALNNAMALYERGVLQKYNVEMIGAKYEAIKKAEDRELFKKAMANIGIRTPRSGFAYTVEESMKVGQEIGFPLIIRPAYTLGGTGGGIVYTESELREAAWKGITDSPIKQILIEESVLGWKEYELEVMKDRVGNAVIICTIENFDAMGVHTGDSITVAPAQTLTDKEYQRLRDYSIAVMREIGVDTGGSNVQFAVNPKNGEVIIIEMNPRVSRSSALASKATGFPIAKIASLLAVGYTLDEIPNDITKKTLACFEPSIDYVVTKMPRWTFEKFPNSDQTLNTQMKSVGEAMAIGRTFKESIQKVLRSMERSYYGFHGVGHNVGWEEIEKNLKVPNPKRILYIYEALKRSVSIDEIYRISKIDPWFLDQLLQIVELETILSRAETDKQRLEHLQKAKAFGFSDRQLGVIWKMSESAVRALRIKAGIEPVYKMVDTCAAEFTSATPYYYSTYAEEDEVLPSTRKKVMILGGGPNRIGQGIEFDYCCVHAAFALKEMGLETIMVNSNPETVSTDYDTSDRLYFEPLTLEDVLNVYEKEKPFGVIVQFGGQTPLKLAMALKKAGVPIIGTDPVNIDVAEDRKLFGELLHKLNILQPENGTAMSYEDAQVIAERIGYPVVVRPSYVLGGRAMEIVYDQKQLEYYMRYAVQASPDHPILVDRFLENALEVDVDAIADGKDSLICGIMEHIEQAGIHSGDSACVLPAQSIGPQLYQQIKEQTYALAKALQVIGLMNIQYAVKDKKLYILEVNPRASRTIPFVSKATGVPWAKMAAKIMAGETIQSLKLKEINPTHISVKEVVLPFAKFSNQDVLLGPEMKSTGEVMGIDYELGLAFAKAEMASGADIPLSGTVFISVNPHDKMEILPIARIFADNDYRILATSGTYRVLEAAGIKVTQINKVHEGEPHIAEAIQNGLVNIVINTPAGKAAYEDDTYIRKTALKHKVFTVTTIQAARAVAEALCSLRKNALEVRALQDYMV